MQFICLHHICNICLVSPQNAIFTFVSPTQYMFMKTLYLSNISIKFFKKKMKMNKIVKGNKRNQFFFNVKRNKY